MSKETKKITKGALCFTEAGSLVQLKQNEGEPKTLLMTAYSGKIIKNHWYWGDLAIDTAGIKMSKSKIPVLHDHETDQKIGFGKFIVNDKHEIVAEDITFVDTPIANEFIKLSAEGFPYEASIQARPNKITRLAEGETADVNGFTMKGPGTVWRESVLRECSVTTFGADANTKSVAMSENEDVEVEVEETKFESKEEGNMTLAELKAAHPELFAEIVAIGTAEAEKGFSEVKAALEAQVTALSAEKQSLVTLNAETDKRVLALEKESALRKEEGIKASAEMIFSDLMAKNSIPERLQPKIRKQINHGSFVAEDVLDVTAFTAAIETELKDWLPTEGSDDSSILGMSFVKSPGTETANVDAMVGRMLKHVGQEAAK